MRRKGLKRKLSNIVLLGILLAILVGIYYNIYNSRAEEVIEIGAVALDNYGYLREEEFKLEAKDIGNDLYEIELPETINGKKINSTIKIVLENIQSITDEEIVEDAEEQNSAADENVTTAEENAAEENTETLETNKVPEETVLEVSENKIQLTKEQLENGRIKIEVAYDVAIIEQAEDGTFTKHILAEKTEEERQQLEVLEGTSIVYYKILKHEDEENNRTVEVKGYLPRQAQLQAERVNEEDLTEIFGQAQVNAAYDIKIVIPVEKPVEKENEDGVIETQSVTEYFEINPKNFGESCEVTIKDTNIVENSQVYHVKEDKVLEEVTVKENSEETISFEAQTFSVYAVSSGFEEVTFGEETMVAAVSDITFSPTSAAGSSIVVTASSRNYRLTGYAIDRKRKW